MNSRWPNSLLGAPFSLKEANLICWLLLSAGLVIFLFVIVEGRRQSGKPVEALGPDYATFYIMGRIVNESEPEHIYDLPLQQRLYNQLRPGEPFGFANP